MRFDEEESSKKVRAGEPTHDKTLLGYGDGGGGNKRSHEPEFL